MSVNALLRNKEKYNEFYAYWKTIAENNMYLQHTATEMHFVRHSSMRLGAVKKTALKSPYMGLENPTVRPKNNTFNNIQWVWTAAIVIASEVQYGNEDAEQQAMTDSLVILQSILSKLKSDRMNNRLVFFDFESVTINPVYEHFKNCVGYRMQFSLPSQFDLTFNSDEWQNEPNAAEPVPFATVNDQGDIVILGVGDAWTCSVPVPGTASVRDSAGNVLATSSIPSNTIVPIPLADVAHTDSDGSTVTKKAQEPFVATPFTPAIFKLNNVTVGSAGNGGQLLRRVIRPTGVFVSTYDGIDANIVANSPIIQNGGTIDSTGAEQAFQFNTLLDEIAENGIYDALTKTLRFTSVQRLVGSSAGKSGVTTSYQTGDTGYQEALEDGDFFTLDFLNPYNTDKRFLDTAGTELFTNGVVIDWNQWRNGKVRGYSRIHPASGNHASQVTNCLNFSVGTWTSGWHIWSRKQMEPLVKGSLANPLGYAPFLGYVDLSAALVTGERYATAAGSYCWSLTSLGWVFPKDITEGTRSIATRLFTVTINGSTVTLT